MSAPAPESLLWQAAAAAKAVAACPELVAVHAQALAFADLVERLACRDMAPPPAGLKGKVTLRPNGHLILALSGPPGALPLRPGTHAAELEVIDETTTPAGVPACPVCSAPMDKGISVSWVCYRCGRVDGSDKHEPGGKSWRP